MADWQIGPHSGTLVTPVTPASVAPDIEEVSGVHVSMGGTETKFIIARRKVSVWTWANLTDTEYAVVLQFVDGTKGRGPWDVKDPSLGTGTYLMNISEFSLNAGEYQGVWSPTWTLREVTPTSA